jgi:hypothetical protein
MDISGAAVGGVRHFESFDPLRGVDEPGAARRDSRIAGVREQRGRPAELELEPDLDEQVGFLELEQERRLGVDEMGILEPTAIDVTSTRSPPTSRAIAARSVVVVTT